MPRPRSPEIKAIQDLIGEAVQAGFYNIDIDTSTMVDLSKKTMPEQQAVNSKLCADFTAFIRQKQPAGIQISVGGEIGEVGGHNSNEEELRAFLGLYADELKKMNPERGGAEQNQHSNRNLPRRGGAAQRQNRAGGGGFRHAQETFLSRAHAITGMGGAVQHGASTLPEDAFRKFPENETCEVHLATNFQNMAFDHLPPALREEIYFGSGRNCADERKEKDTEEQFLYKARKKAVGPFKKQCWDMPEGKPPGTGCGLGEAIRVSVRSIEGG